MIAVISEYRYSKEELNTLAKQKAIVNYTLLPQFYQSYAQEIAKINYTLIRRMNGIVFRLSDYYAGTKDAIEYALYLKKPIKIITPQGEVYKLHTKEEWKQTYHENGKYKSLKHTVLIEFEQHRSDYYEKVNLIKAKEVYERSVEGIEETKEEIERFVRALAPQYKIDVDYNSWVELCNAYRSIKFYYDSNIPYELDKNEVFTRGAIDPEDTPYFTASMFDMSNNFNDSFEEELYGDQTLLEDMIYKGGVRI
ncbi:MAG: hypothetical protein EOL95_09050 [Bacteroidia bacterium]|nr:hypothetical protein [Bacteroidia bacterium]